MKEKKGIVQKIAEKFTTSRGVKHPHPPKPEEPPEPAKPLQDDVVGSSMGE